MDTRPLPWNVIASNLRGMSVVDFAKGPGSSESKKIRDVVSPWGTGFLAKSTTLMFIHVSTVRKLGRTRGTGTRDRCHGTSSLRIYAA